MHIGEHCNCITRTIQHWNLANSFMRGCIKHMFKSCFCSLFNGGPAHTICLHKYKSNSVFTLFGITKWLNGWNSGACNVNLWWVDMRRLHRNNKQTHVGCKRIIRIIINGIIIAKMCWYRMFGITLPLASHNRISLRWKTEWWAMSLSVFSCWRTLTHAHRRSPEKEKNRTFYGVYFLHCVCRNYEGSVVCTFLMCAH